MTTLLSELVRALSGAAARELRSRADGPALSRPEMIALATLTEISAACLTTGPMPDELSTASNLARLEDLAAFDLAIIERARERPVL